MKRYTTELLSEVTSLRLVGATLQVFATGTQQLATLYASNDITGAKIGQPVPNGVAFYLPDGRYDLVAKQGSRTTRVDAVDMFDGVEQNRRLEAVENGEPGALGSLRSDLAAAGGAELVGYRRTSAAILRTLNDWLKDGGFNVRDFGAKGIGDNTDDTAALNRAADEAFGLTTGERSIPILLPANSMFGLTDTVRIRTGVIGFGPSSSGIRSLTAAGFTGGKSMFRVGWTLAENADLCRAVPVRGFRVIGSGKRTAKRSGDPTTMEFEGVGVYYDEQTHSISGQDLRIDFCRKGIDHGNRVGHIYGERILIGNCWYNIFFSKNTGDYDYSKCTMTGALYAGIGCSGTDFSAPYVTAGIGGAKFDRCHFGFAPYGIWQEDGPSPVGLIGLEFIATRFENIGNCVIVTGGTAPFHTGATKNSHGWFFLNPAHSWVDTAIVSERDAYVIQNDANHPVQDYAIKLGLVNAQNGDVIEYAGDTWKAGTSGYHTRVADLQSYALDPGPPALWNVTNSGRERIISRNQRYYVAESAVPSATLSNATTTIATVQVPAGLNGTLYADIEVDLSYTSGEAGDISGFISIVTPGNNGLPQNTGPRRYFKPGSGNIYAKQRVSLGLRAGGSHQVTVQIKLGGPANVTISPDGLNGTVKMTVASMTAAA